MDFVYFIKFLLKSYNEIKKLPLMGSIKGQIQHNIARRMKRLGARWTISGEDRMARVLAAKANGELKLYIWRWPVEHQKLNETAQIKPVERPKAEDVGKWWRASLPVLKKGTFC